MADNVKPTFPKSDVKSGLTSEAYGEKVLDGVPAKKSVDEIEAVNTVHDAPNSTSV
jgi:hypothetical protein